MHTYDGYVAPSDRDILLTFEDLCERWQNNYQTLNNKFKKGYKFPPHITLPCGARRWRREDVLDFEERHANAEIFVRHRHSRNDGKKGRSAGRPKKAAA